jgi:hypothetical protein
VSGAVTLGEQDRVNFSAISVQTRVWIGASTFFVFKIEWKKRMVVTGGAYRLVCFMLSAHTKQHADSSHKTIKSERGARARARVSPIAALNAIIQHLIRKQSQSDETL